MINKSTKIKLYAEKLCKKKKAIKLKIQEHLDLNSFKLDILTNYNYNNNHNNLKMKSS
jgi:hypothetical protein